MKVIIKSISLLNFKGIREFSADFNGDVTEFRGDNATGKTTLNDAFDWLLYDKDSQGRNNFQVKTLNSQNEVIMRLPHEVSAVLDVDGEEIRLRKCFTEVWKKPRGKAEEEFSGHTVERFWNDVPVKEKEYNEKIAGICDEEVFRLITNPGYFFTMKKDSQRSFLIHLAGDVTAERIAEDHPEFRQLVADMSGKTAEEYARETGARIKRVKTEAEGIPGRIDERRRCVPEAEDWGALEAEIREKKSVASRIEKQMANEMESYNAAVEKQRVKLQRKASLELRYDEEKSGLVGARMRQALADKRAQDTLMSRLEECRSRLRQREAHIASYESALEDLSRQRETLIAEWREIKSRALIFDDDDSRFVCPTCGRLLDEDDIDARKAEMTADFNSETARLLEENRQKGLAVKRQRERVEAELASCRQWAVGLSEEIRGYEQDPLFGVEVTMPDTGDIADAPVLQDLRRQIEELDADIRSTLIQPADQSSMKAELARLQDEMNALRVRLANKAVIENNERRISELEDQYRSLNAEIARLEGVQHQLGQFRKTLISDVEDKINGMFTYVRFKMYEQQINGGERETCEALVDGVPYSTNVNTAARVNAGIDIINAISKAHDIHAPIWIDNRESITRLIATESQVINLFKDENYPFLTRI